MVAMLLVKTLSTTNIIQTKDFLSKMRCSYMLGSLIDYLGMLKEKKIEREMFIVWKAIMLIRTAVKISEIGVVTGVAKITRAVVK